MADVVVGVAPEELPVLAVRMRDAPKVSGFGRTQIYKFVGTGELAVAKNGRATIVPMDGERGLRALIKRYTVVKQAAA